MSRFPGRPARGSSCTSGPTLRHRRLRGYRTPERRTPARLHTRPTMVGGGTAPRSVLVRYRDEVVVILRALLLGLVHRFVRPAKEFVGSNAVIGGDSQPNARRGGDSPLPHGD